MPDGSYRPDEKLTRAQAISLILRLSKQPLGGAKLPTTLTDIDSTHWAAPSVAVGIASGMVGLSTDGKQYLPDTPFTRISLAHALGILLTQDPGLYATSLEGILITLEGSVTIQSAGSKKAVEAKTATTVKAGDIIKTGAKSSAELNYPDGSSMLLKENTQITVVESQGRKYIKIDGSEGTALDWLDIKLKQGTMLGGLATKHETTQTENPVTNKTTGQVYQVGSQLIASLDGWELLAAEGEQPPWYVASQQKKVKMQVDMPWGVAAVRGTFVVITVSPNGQSTVGCLMGDAEVTNGGVTVPLSGNQQTGINGANNPPPPSAVLGQESAALFLQANSWLQATAQLMDQNQPAATPPPPGPVPGQTPPSAPPAPPAGSTLGAITGALGTVAESSSNNSNNNNNTDSDGPSTTDLSGFTIGGGSGPSDYLVVNNAKDINGILLSGQKYVTVSTLGIQILYLPFTFVNGSADIYIPANFPGIFELVISIDGVTNPVTVQVSGWVPVGNAGFTSNPVDSTSLVIHDGNPYVAYKDSDSGKAVVRAYFNGDWQTLGSALPETDSAYTPSLAIDSETYLAFKDGSNEDKATVMQYVYPDNWQSLEFTEFSNDVVADTHLALDCSGYPYIAYRNSINDVKVYSFCDDEWVGLGVPGISIGQNDLSFYLDNLDGTAPYIAFSDSNYSGRATVMEYVYNDVWSAVGAASISSGPADYLSMNSNEYQKPYLAYTETSSNQIHVQKFNGSSWAEVGSGLPAGTYNSLCVGEDGPILAYIDDASGRASVMKLVYIAGQGYKWLGGPVHATTTGDSCPSLAIDKETGTIYLAFRDGSQGGKMTVMQLRGISFRTDIEIIYDPDFEMDLEGNYLYVYPGTTVGDLISHINSIDGSMQSYQILDSSDNPRLSDNDLIGYNDKLEVTAEDGVTKFFYSINIYS
ncbi:MAG: hypothetical protein CVU90_13735 [Firmicutes bacterium HGW-Firmicutes-15]|nr:MAG: hypothetical protein CVU90_13735 [Firmicutes bacterium HGW-Firmicutes-15]